MSEVVREIMRKRFPFPEYAVLEEVRDAAGFQACRSADAIVIPLWPSRGLAVHGFEIKVDRRDWLREKKDPAKAEVIASKCTSWSLVSTEDVAKEDEIPDTWGWYEAIGGKLIARKGAAPRPIDGVSLHFLVALMKRAMEPLEELRKRVRPEAEVQEEIQTKAARIVEASKDVWAAQAVPELATARTQIVLFQQEAEKVRPLVQALKASGLPWFTRPQAVIDAIRRVGEERKNERLATELRYALERLEAVSKEIAEVAASRVAQTQAVPEAPVP